MARGGIAMLVQPEGQTEAAQREAERLIPVFERLADDLGLSDAWRTIADVHWMGCRYEQARTALEQAAHYAARAGDHAAEEDHLGYSAGAALWGPLPVPEAIRLCENLAERVPETSKLRLFTLMVLIELRAMEGAFDEARALGDAALELLRDLGVPALEAPIMEALRDAETLAGEPAAAERYARRGCELLAAQGDLSHLSTYAGHLGRILCSKAIFDEALEQAEVCRTTAASDDIVSQALWRSVRGRVLARRGDVEAALDLARDAVRVLEETDAIDLQGLMLLDAHETLRLAGRLEEAQASAREALALFERKGNVVAAERARRLLSPPDGPDSEAVPEFETDREH